MSSAMLPSVRRVVASSAGAPPAAAAAAMAARAIHQRTPAAPAPATQQRQQRRYSSSKPSNPDDGSKALPGVPSNSATTSSATNTTTASPKRRRKAKDAGSAAAAAAAACAQKLPSVPSTQHLPVESLALSTFFSQHRPISVTHSLPTIVTDDAFAAIFATRSGRSSGSGGSSSSIANNGSKKTADVIRTLTRTVHDLEGPVAALAIGGRGNPSKTSTRRSKANTAATTNTAETAAAHARHARQQLQLQLAADQAADQAQAQAAFENADGGDGAVMQLSAAMAGQFLPFQPPPPPVPESAFLESMESVGAEDAAAADADFHVTLESAGDAADVAPGTQAFKVMLTIEEHVDENGDVRLVAHTPQLLDATAEAEVDGDSSAVPRSFFERMALRQLRFDAAQRRRRQSLQLPAATTSATTPAHPDAADADAGVDADHADHAAPTMLAISVKRQRKLRMKKKKYKKLMKRTRTLRRKLDRN